MPKPTLKEQWTHNALARRERIRDEGGLQFTALIDAEHRARLDAVLAHRRREDPKLSKRAWLEAMIDLAFALIKPPAPTRRAKADDRSNAPRPR